MAKKIVLVAALALTVGLAGCKFVKIDGSDSSKPIAADESGDDARIAALIGKTYEPELIPLINSKAVDVAALRTAIAGGLDAAGKQFGHRGAGDGGPWSFAIKGSGKAVAADRQSRAAHVDLDVDGDGKADVLIQLGPVVKGSALRDLAPFYDFSDFRDQIEFAKLGRALNDTAIKGMKVPEGDLVGKTVSFVGAASINAASAVPSVVPTSVEIAP
jgi:predicted lipoprotein